jgi:predicted PurR-regulated permease PerM
MATLAIAAVVLAFWLVYMFRTVVYILLLGIVLGTALQPLVTWLRKRGLTRGHGLIVAHAIILLLVFGILYVSLPTVIRQIVQLAGEVPRYYTEFRSVLLDSPSRLVGVLGGGLPRDIQLVLQPNPASGEDLDMVSRFIGYSNLFFRGLFSVVGVILIASFWILEGERILKSMLILFPASHRERIREITSAIEAKVGEYIRGQLILSIMIGLLALVAYLLIGLPNALTLALIAGIFEVVPIIGPLLGAIPAILVASSIHPTLIVWVVLATVIIQAFENSFLVPRIMRASVGVNPIVTLLALLTFSSLLGLPGALLAIPSAAVIQLLLDRFVFSPDSNENHISDGRDYISRLRYEAQDLVLDVRKQLRRKNDPSNESNDQIEDSIEKIASQLDLILDQISQEESN